MPPLVKQPVDISFAQGLDTKTDPKRVQLGKFLALSNSVFDSTALTKRNGFAPIAPLPVTNTKTLTTFGGSLAAIGTSLYNFAPENNTWYNKGPITDVSMSVAPLVRSATSQTAQDAAVTSTGLCCSIWADSDGTSKYQVNDANSSEIVVSATSLPATASQARVFLLGQYFIITYLVTVSAATHLQFVAIPVASPQTPRTPTDVALQVNSLTAGYDACVVNSNLYFSWYDVAPAVKTAYMTTNLTVTAAVSLVGRRAKYMSVSIDTTTPTPTVWLVFFDSGNSNLYVAAYSSTLAPVLAPTVLVNSSAIARVTSLATASMLTAYYETANTYSYTPNAPSNFVSRIPCTQTGTVGSASIVLRGVSLASKAFAYNATNYLMVAYGGIFQPTYFLSDDSGNVIAKLAYSNGGGYPATQVLPSASLNGDFVQIPYLYKDLLTSVNKTQGVVNVNGIYSQTGVNLVSWSIGLNAMPTAEIGQNLHAGGGFLWMYDGAKPVEHNFHVWPEDVTVTTATGSGSIAASLYYYQVVYEWTDAQGSIHRSAPSVPYAVTTTTASSTNTINIPTLRLTYKTGIKICIYRWSTAQENYYQVTSISSPLISDPTADSVTFTDTLADAAILGNQLIYTTGGVVENIAYPAVDAIALFNSRLVLIDSEDKNLLWYSKQVIEGTPVEPTDLFTIYVAPTAGAQGSTGVNTALGAMDDKLIIFKRNAIYYVNGVGPDNTGANGQFSEPIFVTSTAGCTNPQSIVFMPQGIMFQSDKGIWLLGRDLSTSYIGSPVEAFNSFQVLAAVNVPGTNQVRFTLSNGVTLMYDYFYSQWGTFTGIPGTSSTLFQNLHTYVNATGATFQESPGVYLDGTNPVLMSFTTSWLALAGLQGFERLYFFYLLGTYITPHKLAVAIGYDYNSALQQQVTISPTNFSPKYGGDTLYGSGDPYGGQANVEQWRVFVQTQKCQSFQISVSEIYDPSFSVPAGAGLTLSGINCVIGVKKGYKPQPAAGSVG